MLVRLGVNTCFAVKRWPRPADWAPIVRDRLGVGIVQHSLDLVDLDAGVERIAEQAAEIRDATDACGLEVHSTFTGLAAYSRNLLLDPDQRERRAEDQRDRDVEAPPAVKGQVPRGDALAFDPRTGDERELVEPPLDVGRDDGAAAVVGGRHGRASLAGLAWGTPRERDGPGHALSVAGTRRPRGGGGRVDAEDRAVRR